MNVVFVYVPCPDVACAERLVHAAIEAGSAGCGNVFPAVSSIYRWQGEIRRDTEAVAVLKTRSDRAEELERLLRALHPYETPCIAVFSPASVNADFTAWLMHTLGES